VIPVKRRIYVASSWRNEHQPSVVVALRDAGHEVYDFRNPAPGNSGFGWVQIDPNWLEWDCRTYLRCVRYHPIARDEFRRDLAALDWCDTCVLVLPCGRSAHLEAGYACGQGKRVIFYLRPEKFEPELMYLLGDGFVLDTPP
jgi:nucleoside 2-deoxyribosyltransferase